VYEFAGYKTSTLAITGNPGDGFRISADGFATALDLNSAVNTTGVLAALTQGGDILLFQDSVFRIADLADALQASDALNVTDINIEVNRQLEPVEVNSRARTEALENGFRESTLTFSLPYYTNDFIMDAHQNHTPLQADLVITLGANVKTIQLPKLIVTEYSNNVGGPDFVTVDVTCQIIPDPEGDNAFMTLENTNAELQIIEE
jgi:hypothetical protein